MNNRQARGRGRGRNNNNNRNSNNRGGGGIDRDNRIDNRARGNAAQMLDKYKKMAHDAQVNDDRVNAEYYLQFADHYFRVNADTIARREEQRQAREERQNDNRSDNRNDSRGDDDSDNDKNSGKPKSSRGRQPRDDNKQSSQDASDNSEASSEKKPVRTRRPRKADDKAEGTAPNGAASEANGLDASALPPAISINSDDGVDVEKKPVRKKRVAKPKATEEGDAA